MVSIKLFVAVVLMAVLVGVNTEELCAMPDENSECPGGDTCHGYLGCFCCPDPCKQKETGLCCTCENGGENNPGTYQ